MTEVKRGHNLTVYTDIEKPGEKPVPPVNSKNLKNLGRFRAFGVDLSLSDADPEKPDPKSLLYTEQSIYQYDPISDMWIQVEKGERPFKMNDLWKKKR